MSVRSRLALPLLLLPAFLAAEEAIDSSPAAELAAFVVPDGYEVNLFAAEPMVRKPVQMNWDARGRLWVVSSTLYPQIKPGEMPDDVIYVLEDIDGDGRADKSTEFATGLHIPTAVLPYKNGCFVANSTELLYLHDKDGDLKVDDGPDAREVVYSGFGTEDTHHLIHTLRRAPDGAIHFNQSVYIHSHIETPYGVRTLRGGGIWSFDPETRRLEVVAKGSWNPWGLEYNRWGRPFATDGAGTDGLMPVFPGVVYAPSPGEERFLRGLSPGSPKYSGLENIESSHFPAAWQDSWVTCDFRGNRIVRFETEDAASGYAARKVDDVLASHDRAFRPIDLRLGPDGALYIADWYNPIINHGEVDFRDPRRDHENGRIWRLTAKNKPLVKKPDLTNQSPAELAAQLAGPDKWTRRFALEELADNHRDELPAALAETASVATADNVALLVSQTLQALRWAKIGVTPENDPAIRHASFGEVAVPPDVAWIKPLNPHDPEAEAEECARLVRSSAARDRLAGLARIHQLLPDSTDRSRLVRIALGVLDRPMDENLDFLVERICRRQADHWLSGLLAGTFEIPDPGQLFYALQASRSPDAAVYLMRRYEAGSLDPDQTGRFLSFAAANGTPELLEKLHLLALTDRKSDAPAIREVLLKAARERGFTPAHLAAAVLDELPDPTAMQLAGLWRLEAARPAIESAAASGDAAAFEGLIALGGKASLEFFKTLTAPTRALPLRLSAVQGIIRLDPDDGASQAVAVLADAASEADAIPVFDLFLRNKDSAPLLIAALKDRTLPTAIAAAGVRRGQSLGLTDDLLDPIRKAGGIARMDQTLTPERLQALVSKVGAEGDAARGERVYRQPALQCMVCHAIGETGGLIGPNLVSLGASAPVDYLIESMLEPSKKIKEGYHMTVITSDDGSVAAGALAGESETAFRLRDAAGAISEVPKDRITDKAISPISMMPPGLTASLPEDEFVDLIRFLSELGKEGAWQTPANRYVRTVELLDQTDASLLALEHQGPAVFATRDSGSTWTASTALVDGRLPVTEWPGLGTQRHYGNVFRFTIDVRTAGRQILLSSPSDRLSLWLDGKALEVSDETVLDLDVGVRTVTGYLDRKQVTEPLRLELPPGVGAEAARISLP